MFKKLKEKVKGEDHHSGGQQGQPLGTNNPYNQAPAQQHNINRTEKYEAPSGPPPGHGSSSSGYAPPPGPPPSKLPQQPPPAYSPPKDHHDWTVIPDTAMLPPPPSLGYDSSPTANASPVEGDRALAWTQSNPLWPPQNLTPQVHAAIQNGQLALLIAPTSQLSYLVPQKEAGHWSCKTTTRCPDSSILTNLPLYSVFWDSPLNTRRAKTIYFELKILKLGWYITKDEPGNIAVGFVAPPYPTFRQPGWERGSLGVFSDDGRRFVNDTWGGIDCLKTSFQPGDIVGIGMTFSLPKDPPSYEQSTQGKMMDIDVFFTLNGNKVDHWDGNEQLDARSVGGADGLKGECDLFPAIGVCGEVEFEVNFHPSQWKYGAFDR